MNSLPDGTRVTDAALNGNLLFRIQTEAGDYHYFVDPPGDRPREVTADEYDELLTEAADDGEDTSSVLDFDFLRFPAQ